MISEKTLSREERALLLFLARKSIEDYFEGTFSIKVPEPKYSRLFEKRGAFVTLKKHGNLRGCIGVLEPLYPLYETVQRMAISAAFEDPRFPPLSPEELPEIKIEISVLSPMEKANPEDVIVGKHGIYIIKGFNRGVLLPQVPIEFGWDRETFLKHGCLKAGLHPDCYKDPDTELFIFSAEVFEEGE